MIVPARNDRGTLLTLAIILMLVFGIAASAVANVVPATSIGVAGATPAVKPALITWSSTGRNAGLNASRKWLAGLLF